MLYKIFSAVSILTLSGLSDAEAALAARYRFPLLALLLLARMPWDLLRAAKKKRPLPKSEAGFYLLLAAVTGVVLFLDPACGSAWALLWMLLGGCTHSLAGGFHAGPFLNSIKLMGRSIVLKAHPNAVKAMRRDNAPLPAEAAADDALGIILYMALHLVLSFLLTFGMDSFSDAMLLTAAAMGNGGWLLLLLAGETPMSRCGPGGSVFLLVLMLAGRVWGVMRIKKLRSGKNT